MEPKVIFLGEGQSLMHVLMKMNFKNLVFLLRNPPADATESDITAVMNSTITKLAVFDDDVPKDMKDLAQAVVDMMKAGLESESDLAGKKVVLLKVADLIELSLEERGTIQ